MPAQTDQIAVVRNGTQQMNGMNLGGWLVIEQFLAPEMYKNASKTVPWGPNPAGYGVYGERQIALDAAQQDANDTTGTMNVVGRWRQAIFNHRDTFVTEADFALLASAGINTSHFTAIDYVDLSSSCAHPLLSTRALISFTCARRRTRTLSWRAPTSMWIWPCNGPPSTASRCGWACTP